MLKLIRSGLPKILTSNHVCTENMIIPNLIIRHSSYASSKPIPKPEDLPKYEVTNNEEDWKFVERLLPDTYVPSVEPKEYYPSGWVPQKLNPSMPYILERSKNNMLPIYLKKDVRGPRRMTKILRIHGDMWRLANDVQQYLEKLKGKKVYLKVHEICGAVIIHGDHVSDVKVWALKKGL